MIEDKDKVFAGLADLLHVSIEDAARFRNPPPCVACHERPTLRRDGLCDKCANPATAHEVKPQVIEGYVDPSGKGEGNWSSEK